jgi:hypothetical protein
MVVGVLAGHLAEEVLILVAPDVGVGEELTGGCRDARGCLGRLLLLSHNHVLHRNDEEIAADVENALHDPMAFESGHHVASSVDEGTGTMTFPHDVELLQSVVGGVAGVVSVHNEVTVELSEPRPEPPRHVPRRAPGVLS